MASRPSEVDALDRSLPGLRPLIVLASLGRLRDRFIALIGHGRLTATTKAIDDAAGRISRYLPTQSLVNAAFGLGIGAGLFFIGVPYARLWWRSSWCWSS